MLDACPENYEHWLAESMRITEACFPGQERLVFINAWNEWAEGCHLEPDRKHGRGFLEATLRAKSGQSQVADFMRLEVPEKPGPLRKDLAGLLRYHGTRRIGLLRAWVSRHPRIKKVLKGLFKPAWRNKSTDGRAALKPALFLHIQKTAGSSIVDLAKMAYGLENVVSHGDYLRVLQTSSPLKQEHASAKGEGSPVPEGGAGNFRHVPFVSGHFGFDFARPLLKERYSFTFLRNPAERILSFYYFCLKRDPKEYEIYSLCQALTLDRFLMLGFERPLVRDHIWNNQAWQLANGYGSSNGRDIPSYSPDEILALAIRHLDEFSDIGFVESFEGDRDRILQALGMAPPKGKIVSNATPGRPTARDLPASTLKLLDELTRLDQELYRAAWRKRKGSAVPPVQPAPKT